MFVHGIPFQYVPVHYPILDPARIKTYRSPIKEADARHFIEQFGFEPVHFLRMNAHYPLSRCVEECFCFGDTVFVFNTIPYPRIQLSPNEWGVPKVDMRDAYFVISRHPSARAWFQTFLPGVSFFTTPR